MKLNHVTLLVSHLDRSAAFYERLGLETIVYAPPRYARLNVPSNNATLSIEVMPGDARGSPSQCHVYFECDHLDDVYEALRSSGVRFEQPPTDMSYLWREARLFDPDGHDLRLYSAGSNRRFPPWRLSSAERRALIDDRLAGMPIGIRPPRIQLWTGPRREIRSLFELADDSAAQIEEYLEEGEVLVARIGAPIGHLQLVAGAGEGEQEIKSLAVLEAYQRQGVATKLVRAAVARCRRKGTKRLTVSTAVSSIGALRFYLRRGFRAAGIVRDAFTTASGYDPSTRIDGLPLDDAIVLTLDLGARSGRRVRR
jgi:ribosomal protein S18 acetylase RimI-like enzyme/predicted enzyme related to lactoylglutathione lyase